MRKLGLGRFYSATLIGLCLVLIFLQCLYTLFGNILKDYSYWDTLIPMAPVEILLLILAVGVFRKDSEGLGGAILFFRSFEDEVANEQYYQMVDPIVGCFGRCFAAVGEVGFELRPLDGLMRRVFGAERTVGTLKFDDVRWREELEEIVPRLSLVIVDVTHLTPGVKWELDTALRELGRQRVIALSSGVTAPPAALTGVTYLGFDRHDFEQEFVRALASRLPAPKGLRKAALKEVLSRGISPQLWFIWSCEVFRMWLLKGLMIV